MRGGAARVHTCSSSAEVRPLSLNTTHHVICGFHNVHRFSLMGRCLRSGWSIVGRRVHLRTFWSRGKLGRWCFIQNPWPKLHPHLIVRLICVAFPTKTSLSCTVTNPSESDLFQRDKVGSVRPFGRISSNDFNDCGFECFTHTQISFLAHLMTQWFHDRTSLHVQQPVL